MKQNTISNTMNKHHLKSLLAITAMAFSVSAFAYTGQELAVDAKVTIKEARVIALKALPGKVTDEELESEGGGSGLRYSFDIKQGNITNEVGVDAKSGKVLENAPEGKKPD